jgi:hypothetical protein
VRRRIYFATFVVAATSIPFGLNPALDPLIGFLAGAGITALVALWIFEEAVEVRAELAEREEAAEVKGVYFGRGLD